jgi:hypothetical protein
MQDLHSIYADIKNTINNQEEPGAPALIYTGIGTVAGLRNENGQLDSMNYHQYPPFLQDLKNKYPFLSLFIVLIDPIQENPPYMIADKGFLNNNVESNDDTKYKYDIKAEKITIYVLKQNVITEPYIDPYKGEENKNNINAININAMTDITNDLRDLNQYTALKNNVTTVYHDFTGRRNDLIAEYFDEEIAAADLNHIIYGLSVREDHGCYFDLNLISSFMPYRLNNAGSRIEFFNIFQYIKENRIKDIASDAKKYYPPSMHEMIHIQSEKAIAAIKTEFKNNIFSTMRVLLKLIRGEEKIEDGDKEKLNNYLYIFRYIPKTKQRIVEEKFKQGLFREVFDYLIDFFSLKMEILVKLKQLDLTGKELIQFVINEHEEDMYCWYDNLNYFTL